jgi:hypothetical protein
MSALPNAIQRQVDEAAAAEAVLAQQSAVAQEAENPSQQQDATPVQEVQPAPPAPSEDWQHKYRTLQGVHAQMRGELQAKLKTYESEMSGMRQQLDALVQQKQAEATKEAAKADPKDVENFGADLVEMVQRYAERVFRGMSDQFGQKAAQMDSRLSALEQAVNGVSQKTDSTLQQQFYATLTALVPDWQEINRDQMWLQWLGEVDPIYGVERQAALDSAHQALDAERAAAVFRAFRSNHPKKTKSLAEQVSPSGVAAAPAPTQRQQGRIWTQREIEDFYAKSIRGKYSPDEAARIEAEINQAAAEGRVSNR